MVGAMPTDFDTERGDFGQTREIGQASRLAELRARGQARMVKRRVGTHINTWRSRDPVAGDADMRQGFQHRVFDPVHIFFDKVTGAFQVDQRISHHLARPVKRDLPAPVAGYQRNIACP